MKAFASADELYAVITPFLDRVTTGNLRSKFSAVGDMVLITYSDPDAQFLLDTRHDPPQVRVGDDASVDSPDIELSMSADNGHKLWLGELNITSALATRKIKVSGPLMKLLGLVPVFQPVYAEYRSYLTEIGRPELLKV